MPRGIRADGRKVVAGAALEAAQAKAKRTGIPIQDEGAEPKNVAKPEVIAPVREVKLPAGVPSAKQDVSAAVARARGDREVERSQKDILAAAQQFKVSGPELILYTPAIGTSGTPKLRERLAEMAGVVLKEDGYFFISRADSGGRGSAEALPTVWFEAEVVPMILMEVSTWEGMKFIGGDVATEDYATRKELPEDNEDDNFFNEV